MSLDITIDNLACGWVHGYRARAVDGTVGHDRLAVDTLERCWRLVGRNYLLVGHGCVGNDWEANMTLGREGKRFILINSCLDCSHYYRW